IQKVLRLLVASSDGTLYIYNLDVVDGGDCNLIKQHKLLKKYEPLPEMPLAAAVRHEESGGSHRDSTDSKDSTNTESEKFHEMSAATTPPEKDGLKLDDDVEFPPVTLNSD
ncbi:hypothetical protein GE061_004895, partial [Apolygus lucorum]